VLELLSRLVPAVVRHVLAYGELLSVESAAAARELRRQLLALLIVGIAGALAVLMGCVWVIGATWDTPHRMPALSALCLGFTALTLAAAWFANSRPRGRPRPFERVSAEWQEDLRQLAGLYPSLAGIERVPAATSEVCGD
jgi:uncharacterized membrane protein YqjE